MNINRREALARLVAITGSVAIGSELLLTGCRHPSAKDRSVAFAPADVALLDEVAETIIPATETPGAKAAAVGAFMARSAHDCYDDESYASFRRGIGQVDDAAKSKYGRTFMQCSPAERTALLTSLDREQRDHTREKAGTEAPHYFRLMKELTLIGYFSSEIGCTKALRYAETPGKYIGDAPYRKGDRAWYNPSRRLS